MVRKTTISSVLSQEFGIEDFMSGTVRNGSDSINSYEISNRLGLLAPLADRNNTDPISFASEAYNFLGEANQIIQFVDTQLKSINDRFTIANEIKRNYGIENFDPFSFGLEGFVDKIKEGFVAVIAVFKKIIQAISNWIRSVLNWIGSQFAKLQAKLIEKYGNEKFTNESVTIKAIVPSSKVTSGVKLLSPFNAMVIGIGKSVKEVKMALLKSATSGEQTKTLNAATAAFSEANSGFTSFHGTHISVVKLGSATASANKGIFGTPKPQKIIVSALAYITKHVEWKTILSLDDLKGARGLVADGKALIKVVNELIKDADKLAKSLKITGVSKKDMTEEQKAQNDAVKATRKQISILNNANRVCSLATGTLFGAFSNYLKIRSYAASAVRALAKDSNAGKQKPKEGSRKDRLLKARAAI